jgi:hypothetical protein
MKKIISISLIAMAGLAVSSAALSGGGIPGGFPAHDTAVGKMPAHVYGSLPTFPPSRAVSQPSGVQTQSIPSMPDRSLQGTSRIPSGPGRDGFNNRGRR